MKEELYPYLLVNLRNGASFTKVSSRTDYKRVIGTSIGVSLVWGIVRYLDLFKDPTEMCEAAATGDSSSTDMSVGDIYGGSYDGIGLPGNMIASSFAKVKDLPPDEVAKIPKEDIARSLLTLISANILIFSKMIAQ